MELRFVNSNDSKINREWYSEQLNLTISGEKNKEESEWFKIDDNDEKFEDKVKSGNRDCFPYFQKKGTITSKEKDLFND